MSGGLNDSQTESYIVLEVKQSCPWDYVVSQPGFSESGSLCFLGTSKKNEHFNEKRMQLQVNTRRV